MPNIENKQLLFRMMSTKLSRTQMGPKCCQYLNTAVSGLNNFVSELEFIGGSLAGIGTARPAA